MNRYDIVSIFRQVVFVKRGGERTTRRMSKGGMTEKENKDGVKCREHSTIKIATFNFEDLLKYRTCAQIYVFFLSWWDLRPLFFLFLCSLFVFSRGNVPRDVRSS